MRAMTELHFHAHVVPDELAAELAALKARVTALEAQGATLMTRQDEVNTLIGRLDAATNEIASDLTRLREEIRSGTVSAESTAMLDARIAQLEALGQDPENPVPETGGTGTEAPASPVEG